MIRKAFTIASAVSLVLCIGTAVLWVRSYFKLDGTTIVWQGREYYWFSGWGTLAGTTHRCFPVVAGTHHAGLSGGGTWNRSYDIAPGVGCGAMDIVQTMDYGPVVLHDARRKRLTHPEVELRNYAIVLHSTQRDAHVHDAYVVVLFAILPSAIAVRRLRRRRQMIWLQGGCCTRCGYNLTGNTSGICPECGGAVVPSAPATPDQSLRG